MGLRDRLHRHSVAAESEKQRSSSPLPNDGSGMITMTDTSDTTYTQQRHSTLLDPNTDGQTASQPIPTPPYSEMARSAPASEEKTALAARYAFEDAESLAQTSSTSAHENPISEKTALHQFPTVSRTHFASLSLHMTDRLRMLNFPAAAQETILSTVKSTWTSGIQATRDYYGSAEIKLRGNPWRGAGDESIYARELLRKILEALYNTGWVLSLSTDISKKQFDLDTLIFRAQSPTPTPCTWMVVAFSKSDRLRLIAAPREVVDSFTRALGNRIQIHGPYQISYVYEYKLKGYPWMPSGGETVSTRQMVMLLLTALEENGFSVYASIDQKTGPLTNESYTSETDTWFCTRSEGWTSELPVYQG